MLNRSFSLSLNVLIFLFCLFWRRLFGDWTTILWAWRLNSAIKSETPLREGTHVFICLWFRWWTHSEYLLTLIQNGKKIRFYVFMNNWIISLYVFHFKQLKSFWLFKNLHCINVIFTLNVFADCFSLSGGMYVSDLHSWKKHSNVQNYTLIILPLRFFFFFFKFFGYYFCGFFWTNVPLCNSAVHKCC